MRPSTSRVLDALLAAAQDEAARGLPRIPGQSALRRHAARRLRNVAALRATLATAHWMGDRVHRDAADARPDAEPALAAGLAERLVLVVDVADLADRRA